MTENYLQDCIYMLDNLTIESYLKRKLTAHYYPEFAQQRNSVLRRIEQYNSTILDFKKNYRIKKFELDFIIPHTPEYQEYSITNENTDDRYPIPDDPDINIPLIIKEAVLFFKQGKELLATTKEMPEFSRPIIEYYAFLQIVKGVILLEFKINKSRFLRGHGLSFTRNNEDEPDRPIAKLLDLGVFQSLIIMESNRSPEYLRLNFYEKYYYEAHIPIVGFFLEMPLYTPNLLDLFIGLWSLSSLVRYEPKTWQLILSGTEEDELIRYIRRFTNFHFPVALGKLLERYTNRPSVLSYY